MASGRYKYLCIKEDNTVDLIASQDIQSILDEYQQWDNPYTSIIRQDLYWSYDEGKYKETTWKD